MTSQSSIGKTLDEKGYNKNRFTRVMYPNRRDICFFHQVFGQLSRKCELKGCRWNNFNSAMTMNARINYPYNNRPLPPTNLNVYNRSKN